VARDGDAGALLEVSDNGRGFTPASPGAKKGLGTRLVAAFVGRIGGSSEVRSSAEGTAHLIRVPLR
jgi:two-component sensor histidine kinase